MNQRTGKWGWGRERRKGDRDEGRGEGIEMQGERGTQSLWTEVTHTFPPTVIWLKQVGA